MNGDQDGRDDPQSLQLDSQTQTLINMRRELAKVKDDLGQATQTIGQLFLEKQQCQQRIRALERQVDGVRGPRPKSMQPNTSSAVDQDKLLAYSQELRHTRAELKTSEDARKRLEEVVEMYECELSGLRQELQDTKSVLDERGKELVRTAALSSGTADTSDLISDIIEKVVVLNGEIFRAAATLGGSMECKSPELEATTVGTTKTFNLAHWASARSYISEKLINILIKESRNNTKSYPNPLLVQLVLRVFLVTFCSGTPALSYTEPVVEGWNKQLLQDLGHVLRIAHWTPNTVQRECFQKQLHGVFTATQDLRNTLNLGKDFTSCDFDIAFIKAGAVFQPSLMEDAYGDPGGMATEGQDPQEIVVGVVGIGLKEATAQTPANEWALYEHAVLPAKVALESTLMESLAQEGREKGSDK